MLGPNRPRLSNMSRAKVLTTAERVAALRYLEKLCEEERASLSAEIREEIKQCPQVIPADRIKWAAEMTARKFAVFIETGKLAPTTSAFILIDSDSKKNITKTHLETVLDADEVKRVWESAPIRSYEYVAVRFAT
jgi:hypothetical protein